MGRRVHMLDIFYLHNLQIAYTGINVDICYHLQEICEP